MDQLDRVLCALGVSMSSTSVSADPVTTPPGSFFLAVIPGLVGRGVSAAQAFTRGGCLWTHAGVYVGDGHVVQAEPGGVRNRAYPDHCGGPILWSDAPIQRELARADLALEGDVDLVELEALYRTRVTEAAVGLVDSPYAWLDFVTIAAAEWRMPGWQRLRTRVDGAGGFLCSSLVDRAYAMAGIQLFDDKRPQGQVTPADLARLDDAWMRERIVDLERRLSVIEGRAA